MKSKSLRPLVALLVTTSLLTATLHSETHYVTVDDSGFSPEVLNINVGDTVFWVNNDEFGSHTSTSDLSPVAADYWRIILFDFEEADYNTFDNPGPFTYRDESTSLTGTINVSSVGTPEITLSAPRIESGLFLFEATGLTLGNTNVLETSTNLVQWTAIQTNLADATTMTLTNTVQPGANLFRLVELQ